jgi:ADP-heptose:LPS heptosyltransferase
MYLTNINEVAVGNSIAKPFYIYHTTSRDDENVRKGGTLLKYAELADSPMLARKKYYTGCIKNGDSIIIKRLGGAGDVIWTLPVAAELKRRFPKTKIGYWIGEHHFGLIDNNPNIDEKLAHSPTMEILEKYDWILDYYESIERYNPAEYEEAYDTHWRWAFNEPAQADKLLGHIFIKNNETDIMKLVFKNKYIVVSMSSSNPKRTYFLMPIIIKNLAETFDGDIIVTGQGVFGKIPEAKNIINLINKTSLREILVLINSCDLLVCTDSGNAHFAGQLRKKAVVIYSTAHADTRVKYYPTHYWIQSPEWCAPCVKLGEYCAKEPECLSRISPTEVLNKVKEALK